MVKNDIKEIKNNPKLITVGLQHLLACFGATILVPILVGFPVSIALFGSGVGTLVFHKVTDNKIPAYLGSSFAFIAPLSMIVSGDGGIPAALGGIIFAGIIYIIFSYLFKLLDNELIFKLFPPVVVGPIIAVIGLSLAPVAIDQVGTSGTDIMLALITLLIAITVLIKGKGLVKILPIIIGITGGYITSMFMGVVDYSVMHEASLIGIPSFQSPAFNLNALLVIGPVALVTIIEHIGDILAISQEKHGDRRLIRQPGLDKSLLGDGLATGLMGLIGGIPNTTYGESVGVMGLTKIYNPLVMRIAAVFAIIISFIPFFEAIIISIPDPVIGGISILLFGMITSIGLKTLSQNNVDLNKSRNLIIVSVILILGLGGAVINFGTVEISSMVIAALAGISLNLIISQETEND